MCVLLLSRRMACAGTPKPMVGLAVQPRAEKCDAPKSRNAYATTRSESIP
jgi:hypothetical protein